MKKSLTFVGLLAITGANAGAVDLTEGDFDAQVFESGKVRFSNIDLMMRRRAFFLIESNFPPMMIEIIYIKTDLLFSLLLVRRALLVGIVEHRARS